MLLTFKEINSVLQSNNIQVNGALHIGAHECEELFFYINLGIYKNIIWIDAIKEKVIQAKSKGASIYEAIITDKDDEDITFNISNNSQSSSVLEFGTHLKEHPTLVYVDKIQGKSITVDTFFERNGLNAQKYDFWNFDIQGAELMALKGATKSIQHAKVLYLEVNEKELYKGCALVKEIDDFLAQHRFKRVLTSMTKYGWGDALYILEK
jgi:FkbM family methyltransferase